MSYHFIPRRMSKIKELENTSVGKDGNTAAGQRVKQYNWFENCLAVLSKVKQASTLWHINS